MWKSYSRWHQSNNGHSDDIIYKGRRMKLRQWKIKDLTPPSSCEDGHKISPSTSMLWFQNSIFELYKYLCLRGEIPLHFSTFIEQHDACSGQKGEKKHGLNACHIRFMYDRPSIKCAAPSNNWLITLEENTNTSKTITGNINCKSIKRFTTQRRKRSLRIYRQSTRSLSRSRDGPTSRRSQRSCRRIVESWGGISSFPSTNQEGGNG